MQLGYCELLIFTCNLTIYVGIDIAKLKHFSSAIFFDGTRLMMQAPYRFVSFHDLDSILLKQPGGSWVIFFPPPIAPGYIS